MLLLVVPRNLLGLPEAHRRVMVPPQVTRQHRRVRPVGHRQDPPRCHEHLDDVCVVEVAGGGGGEGESERAINTRVLWRERNILSTLQSNAGGVNILRTIPEAGQQGGEGRDKGTGRRPLVPQVSPLNPFERSPGSPGLTEGAKVWVELYLLMRVLCKGDLRQRH